MKKEQLAALIEAIRKGPEPVIGFDQNGPSQRAFDMGWNAAKDQVWAQLKALGFEPGSNENAGLITEFEALEMGGHLRQ